MSRSRLQLQVLLSVLAAVVAALALVPCAGGAQAPNPPLDRQREFELAQKALDLLDAYPDYAFGSQRDVEAWVEAIVDEQATEGSELLEEAIHLQKKMLGVKPQEEAAFKELIDRHIGPFLRRREKVYEPVLSAATLAAKLKALYPGPDDVVEADDLTRVWLRRHVLEFVRLHRLNRHAALARAALEKEVRQIFDLGPRAVGQRGHQAVRRRVLERFRRVGLEYVKVDGFRRAAPIDEGATVRLPDGSTHPLYAIWPNQAMPSTLPDGGIDGPVVYLGSGKLVEADGQRVKGAIALLDFTSLANWQWATMLGAKAVIFLHEPRMQRHEGSEKFINLPVTFPRYYADEALSARLKALAGTGARVHLEGKMRWQNVDCGNVLGFLPATSLLETRAALRRDLEKVGAGGAVPKDLAAILSRAAGKADKVSVAEVAKRDLADWPPTLVRWLLARRLREASGGDPAGFGREAAARLETLKEAREAMVVVGPLDSLSCAPAAPHGAEQSGSLVGLMAVAEFLGSPDNLLPRNHPVLFVAVDSQFQAMYGARSLGSIIRYGETHFSEKADEIRSELAEVEKINNILGPAGAEWDKQGPGAYEFGTDPQAATAERALKKKVLERLNFRRVGVAGLKHGEQEGTFLRAVLVTRLAYYKMTANLKTVRDLLRATALVDRSEGEAVDLEAVLEPYPDEKSRARALRGMAASVEAAETMEQLESLPAETLAVLRAVMTDQDITLGVIRRLYAQTLGRLRRQLAANEEDARLARRLTGFEHGAAASDLAKRLEKNPDDKDLQKEALALLARLVQEEAHTIPVGFCIDLASHSTQLTLGSGSSAFAAGGIDSKFRWAVLTNVGRRFMKSGRFMNRVLGLTRLPPFVDTASIDVAAQYTPSPGSSPTGPLTLAKVTPYVLQTVEEPKFLWNTPSDVPDNMDFAGLGVQAKMAAALLAEILSEPSLFVPAKNISNGTTQVSGRIVKFDIRAGPFPNMPVPGALVYFVRASIDDRGGKGGGAGGGVFSHLAVLADEEGRYEFLFEPDMGSRGGDGDERAWPFDFDYSKGVICLALDQGEAQTVRFGNVLELPSGRPTGRESRNMLVFDCAQATLFHTVDPRYLRALDGIQTFDARSRSEPHHFSHMTYMETKDDTRANCAVVFVPPETPVQVTMDKANVGRRRMVLLGSTEQKPTGVGYGVGYGLVIENTPLRVAEDMLRLSRHRLDRLAEAGIRSTKLDELMDAADAHVAEARNALAEQRYADMVRHADAAWGYAARTFPEVKQTADDAVFGVVFFLALLLPFAYFLERLTMHFKTAVYRVLGMGIWFGVVFAILYWVHPAFQISLTPMVILLAFMLLVLASVVLVLVSARFGEQVKKWRHQAGGVHSADVSRLSTGAVAFSLGIANLGKRKSRTVLTIVTLILLAFSVISFTSIQQAADHYPIALGGGALFDGLMFRMPLWTDMPESVYQWLELEFGGRHTVVRRGDRRRMQGGWGQAQAHANEMPFVRMDRPDLKAIVHCMAGLEAEERNLSRIDRCVTGRWMEPGEDDVLILPENIAAQLQIGAEDVGPGAEPVKVLHAGRAFSVIGILDVEKADRILGLNNEPISPINYLESGSVGRTLTGRIDVESEVGTEHEFVHMGFDDTVIAPLGTLLQMSYSYVKSVCVRFAPGTKGDELIKELMSRLAINVYAGVDGERYLIRSVGMKTIRPDWTLIAPVVLAVLIILNTMLGTVEERRSEIEMLGAVGLAPRHVAMLFFTEASVYANAGVVVGYLAGQVIAKLVVQFGWFEELSLNYSSLAALFMAAFVAFIVLAATVYPARKAAALATPSGAAHWAMPEAIGGRRLRLALPFTLTRGNAIGMAAFLNEYFESHVEPTSPDFSTAALRTRVWVTGERATLVLQMTVYPAPYDLGVSQRCRIIVHPTDREGVYGVRFSLRRISSDEGSWMRTNFRFMDLIRKQFLIWRTIEIDQRRDYIERGLRLFR